MSTDFSQVDPAAEATPTSISAPEPTGTADASIPAPAFPAAATDNPDAVRTDDVIEAPEGTSEVQMGRWKQLSTSRDEWKTAAEKHAEQVTQLESQLSAFEGILEDSAKFADIARRDQISDRDVYEFEQMLFDLNQPLWEAFVRKSIERYGPQLGATEQQAPPPAQSAYGQQQAPGAAFDDLPEGFEGELEYYGETNPAVKERIERALAAEKRLAEYESRFKQMEDRHAATTAQEKDFNHDMQFADYVVGMFEQHNIPRAVRDPTTGVERTNPVLEKWIEDLMTRVENDPKAGADLERSRRAYRGEAGNQRAAIPALGAKVRAAIGEVFTRDVAPRLAGYQPVPALPPAELRARAEATPPPAPGGATAPVPGQNKELPIRERIKAIYAQHGAIRR